MRTILILLAALPLAILVAGCEQKQSEDRNIPATNSPAAEQSAPNVQPSKTEVTAPAPGGMVNTNLPAPTNAPATNAPVTGNQ